MRLLITNGHLIDPAQNQNSGMDIFIENGKVAAWIGRGDEKPKDVETFDASGLLVAPGFIDMHARGGPSLRRSRTGRRRAARRPPW